MSRFRDGHASGEAGYFMTDAAVGLFVLASVATGLVSAFGLARSLSGRAEHTAKGLVIARSCIEDQTFGERGRKIVLDGLEYGELRSAEALEKRENDVVNLVRISCVVKWTEKGSTQEIRLERIDVRPAAP